ncbi:MAG TPA: PQQ-binding-like beta-propeller repeat protein [archaeon]|nr:PQQ-binding-like beta-propeller repeat protein [archaeon]
MPINRVFNTVFVFFALTITASYAATTLDSGKLKWKSQVGRPDGAGTLMAAEGSTAVAAGVLKWKARLGDHRTGLAASGEIKFRYGTEDMIWEPMTPALGNDGTIYIGSDDNKLYALNEDGTLKWSYQTGGAVGSSAAIGHDGTIYIGSADHYLYALNPEGTLKWRFKTGLYVWSSPAIGRDGTIYMGSSDSYFYALNPDGTLKWKYRTWNSIFSSPAIEGDGTVYFGSDDRYVYALNPDGTLKWRYRTGGEVYSSVAISYDGTVYVGSKDGHLYALKPDGTLNWKTRIGAYVNSSPAIGEDGTVYFGSFDNFIYAFQPDGVRKWKYQTGDLVNSSPAIGCDGTIYFGSHDKHVYALNPDGTLKWRLLTDDCVSCSPAVGNDGTIYIGSMDFHLYAIDSGTNSGLSSSIWPKFRRNMNNNGNIIGTQNSFDMAGGMKFRFGTGDRFWWSMVPAIGDDNTIYFGSQDRYFYALLPDGTLKWMFGTGDIYVSAPVLDNQGTIYFGSGDSHLYALDPDGALKWRFKTGRAVYSAPAIGSDGTIYFGSADSSFYALDMEGDLKWKFETDSAIVSSPSIARDGTIYFGSNDHNLYALSPDGNLKWRFLTDDQIYCSPAIGRDGTIYFGSVDNYFYVLNPDGSLKWSALTGEGVISSPAIGRDGTIYLGSEDFYIYAANPDGSLKWAFRTGDQVISSPLVGSDGTIYVASLDNFLYALDQDGTLKWRYQTGKYVMSSPAIDHDGTIYLGSADNYFYAISSSSDSGLAQSLWPKKSRDYWNTGRFFSVTLCVWPGDTDNNGYVDIADILALVSNIGKKGPPRSHSSSKWTCQSAEPWDPDSLTYLDCNGDGVLDQEDIFPIILNIHKSHTLLASAHETPGRQAAVPSGDMLRAEVTPFLDIVNTGEEAERLYQLRLNLDPCGIERVRGLSFAVEARHGAEIVSVNKGDIWSKDVLFIAKEVIGHWGVGITELPNSSIQPTADKKSLINIIFRPEDTPEGAGFCPLEIEKVFLTLSTGETASLESPTGNMSGIYSNSSILPETFSLSQNFPNPFNPSTTIYFSLPKGSTELVRIMIYDLRGRLLRILVDEVRNAGIYSVFWDGTDETGHQLPSGVYLYRIQAGKFAKTRKMVLLK